MIHLQSKVCFVIIHTKSSHEILTLGETHEIKLKQLKLILRGNLFKLKIPRNQQWLPDRFPQKHFLSFPAKCLPSNPILSAKRPDLKQSPNPTELRLKTFSELDYEIVTNSKNKLLSRSVI